MLVSILNRDLPIWITSDLEGDSRIDNNFYHATFWKAKKEIDTLNDFDIVPLSRLIDNIFSGVRGFSEGVIPVIEGINIVPNVILSIFEKFIEDVPKDKLIEELDILISKHGSPGAVCCVTQIFLKEFSQAIVGTEVFVVRLKEKYKFLSAYISCWLNSTYGQALLRRYIAGSVSPTLRQDDLKRVLIPIPKDKSLARELANECEKWLEELQAYVLESTNFIKPSEEIIKILGNSPELPRLPTNWYSGVGRDPHGFHRKEVSTEPRDNLLNPFLPIWVSKDLAVQLSDRLDNNYWHPAYKMAEDWLNTLGLPIKTIGQLKEQIFVGETPKEDGEIPVIEGRNIKPNCIFPDFQKYTDNYKITLKDYDLLIVRSGTSGLTAVVLSCIRQDFEELAVSDHIHVVRLKEEYKNYAPFICVFLNSQVGQALLRRYIGGSISPTLNRRDLIRIPIPLPEGHILKECENMIKKLQESFLQSSKLVDPSNRLLQRLGLYKKLPKLPVNWMPGGKRDPHGYDI